MNVVVDNRVTDSELNIPRKTLPFGIYNVELTTQLITTSDTYSLSTPAYIQIIPSSLIYVYVTKARTTMITLGKDQDLSLEPGKYSVDGDGHSINIDVSSFDCRESVEFLIGCSIF